MSNARLLSDNTATADSPEFVTRGPAGWAEADNETTTTESDMVLFRLPPGTTLRASREAARVVVKRKTAGGNFVELKGGETDRLNLIFAATSGNTVNLTVKSPVPGDV